MNIKITISILSILVLIFSCNTTQPVYVKPEVKEIQLQPDTVVLKGKVLKPIAGNDTTDYSVLDTGKSGSLTIVYPRYLISQSQDTFYVVNPSLLDGDTTTYVIAGNKGGIKLTKGKTGVLMYNAIYNINIGDGYTTDIHYQDSTLDGLSKQLQDPYSIFKYDSAKKHWYVDTVLLKNNN